MSLSHISDIPGVGEGEREGGGEKWREGEKRGPEYAVFALAM